MNKIKSINKQYKNFSTEKKFTIVYILILLFAFIPTYNHIFDSKLAFLGDNANYYVLGKAIANGDGYINAQMKDHTKANSFPPGYPLFIAVTTSVFNQDISTVKITNGVLYFASLIILFFFFKQISKNIHLSFIITLIMLFNVHHLQFSTWMMSEIPFIFFSSLGLLALSKINIKTDPWKSPWFFVMLFTIAYSFHIRSQGIALFGAVGLYYLIQRNWKYMFSFGIGFVALALPWFIRGRSFDSSPYETALKYKDYYDRSLGEMEGIGDWLDRFYSNFDRYISSEIPSAIFGYQPDYEASSWLTGIFIFMVISFGIFRLKKYHIAIASYILATFAILMIWPPVWTGVRFVLPIIPLMIFLFFYGIYEAIIFIMEITKVETAKVQKVLPYVFILFVFIYTPQLKELKNAADAPVNPLYRNYFAMAEWTKDKLPKDAVIMCRKPMLFHLYSEHFVNRIPKLKEPEEFFEALKKREYTHIVFYGDGLSQKYVLPMLKKYPEKFPIINQTSKPEIYLIQIKL